MTVLTDSFSTHASAYGNYITAHPLNRTPATLRRTALIVRGYYEEELPSRESRVPGHGSRGGRGGRGGGRQNSFNNSKNPSRYNNNRPSTSKNADLEIPVVRIGPGQTSTFFCADTWQSCGASEPVIAALQALGIQRPSHVQAAAFKALTSAAPHLVIGDHAGSGKTLAYLLPLIQAIKAEEFILGGPSTLPNSPRVVIVVPTSELCAQVLRVCRALSSKNLPFRSLAVTGGRSMRTQKEALDQGVDILIGTPGRLNELLSSSALKLDNCGSIVCDEVDVLLGGASLFAEQIEPLKKACPDTTRWILVTATLPADTYMELEPLFPGIVAALGPGLHRTAPGVTEQIVDCSGGDEISEESGVRRKSVALFASLQEKKAPRSIVFCNKIENCRRVENFLNRTFTPDDDVLILPYHAAIESDQREKNLKRFLAPPASAYKQSGELKKQQSPMVLTDSSQGQRLILVCTDRASRGVDSAFVDHVILFDFPRDPSEYVRRVGRTARGAGGQGVVTVLVMGRQVKLAQDVIGRNQRGLPVHALPPIMSATQTRSVMSVRSDELARFADDLEKARRTNNGNKNNGDSDDTI